MNSDDGGNRKDAQEHVNSLSSDAELLLDFAINRGLDVPDTVITEFNRIKSDVDGVTNRDAGDAAGRLRILIRDLTTATYPTNAETLRYAKSREGRFVIVDSAFQATLLFLAVCSIGASIWAYSMLTEQNSVLLWRALFAASLGLLGSVVYCLFDSIGLISEKVFSHSDEFGSVVRLILGPILGWVLYYGFSQEAFAKLAMKSPTDLKESALLLLPFLAGYSTRLVFGIFNQLIKTVELTLGMDEKARDVLSRKKKEGMKSQ